MYATEQLRWFDDWLKGIDNGIMDEPERWTWSALGTWPLPGSVTRSLYASEGKSGSAGSVNDGFLSPEPPWSGLGKDTYPVDPATTVGKVTGPRTPNRGVDDPDMSSMDAKGLTYTTPPLAEDLMEIGHPVSSFLVENESRFEMG